MPPVPQMLNSLHNILRIIKQIADQHNQRPVIQLLGNLIQNRPRPSLLILGRSRQLINQYPPLPRIIRRLDEVPHLLVKHRHSRRILLMQRHIRQRSRNARGMIKLAPLTAPPVAFSFHPTLASPPPSTSSIPTHPRQALLAGSSLLHTA